jgi:membrane protein implicated in regulation of membrane protease activity
MLINEIIGGRRIYIISGVAILVVLWLLGFTLNIDGGLIHILIVIALIVFIYDMVARRRTAA